MSATATLAAPREAKAAAPGFWDTHARDLGDAFPGRAEQILAMQLAVLAGEHIFLLGPPGTGKTTLVRAFAASLEGRLFEQSLSRTRSDAAVLGPLDIPGLRDHGAYRRTIDGYLLDCEWAFLDEIGHIAPELGHDLLAALSDRIRHEVDGGRSIHPIPLRTAFTAGNDIPGQDGSDDARALWDRLLVRVPVDYLRRADAASLLAQRDSPAAPDVPSRRLTRAELDRHQLAVRRVGIDDDLRERILDLRDHLRDDGMVFSDRRWRTSLRIVRAHAWLRGRERAARGDLTALRFTLWDDPERRGVAVRRVALASDPALAARLDLVDRARLLTDVCRARSGDDAPTREAWAREARRKHRALAEAAADLRDADVGIVESHEDAAESLAAADLAITRLVAGDGPR
ncbi:AAA family ATPase [Microbacterium sp.]|uniref:AAA family ATPase n=1 Tax=Microbacterium sp. TaxID=51671 RepID=UPI003A8AAADE